MNIKTKMFVKKIYSLHPSRYKFVALDTALEYYSRYVVACSDVGYITWKSFSQWLRTEISDEVHQSIRKCTRKAGCNDCGAKCGSAHKANCPWQYVPEPGSKARQTLLA